MLSFPITGNYTDLYELTMGETYFLGGKKDDTACFDYFFRKTPYGGGYAVFAGLQDLLAILEDLHFTNDDIHFLEQLKLHKSFVDYLRHFHFNCDVYACLEGEVIFPNCPVMRVEGNIIQAQLIETLLLNIVNFESLIATKAARMKYVAGKSLLSDFGLRRAQGPGGVLATKAAIIGGFQSTSSVYAAQRYGLEAVGTMAHSFIESFDTELDAFRSFARSRPDDCIFLVDTYDSLNSGIPNAIVVAKEMETLGYKAKGIRLDSGDLAYLAKVGRSMLDDAGLDYMKIVASNQLDEFVIKSLKEQQAPIDIFGVGTRLATGQPDAALDGVYKLSMTSGKPRLKLSESLEKITLPGIKQVMRVFDKKGMFYGADVIQLADEEKPGRMIHPFNAEKFLDLGNLDQQPLLEKQMDKGRRIASPSSLKDIAAYVTSRLGLLPAEYKRFENPHVYKIGVTSELMKLRDDLRHEHKRVTK